MKLDVHGGGILKQTVIYPGHRLLYKQKGEEKKKGGGIIFPAACRNVHKEQSYITYDILPVSP